MDKTWTVRLKRDISGFNVNSCNAHKIPVGTILIVRADMGIKKYIGKHGELGFLCTKADFDVVKEDKTNG